MVTKRTLLSLFTLFFFSSCLGTVFDNRYFPFLQKPYLKRGCRSSQGELGFHFMSADEAFSTNDDKISILDLHGKFDLNQLADGMVAVGLSDPLVPSLFSSFRGQKILWKTPGTLKAQTVSLTHDQDIWCGLSAGFAWHFMHVTTCNEFMLDPSFAAKLPAGQEIDLDMIRRDALAALGITATSFDQSAVSDIDVYVRYGSTWDHPFSQRVRPFKFRRIDAGLRFGILIPSGHKRDINNPAAVPFGGNGHIGFYVAADMEFEVREDLHIGFISRLSKRVSRREPRRMPAAGEPSLFGAVVGIAEIDPGVTFVFAPYFSVENLRRGLGFRAQYTLTFHEHDTWIDRRSAAEKAAVPVSLKKVNELSGWTGEYGTLSAFYDFSEGDECARIAPVLILSWDFPNNYLFGSSISKTHSVSLSLAVHF